MEIENLKELKEIIKYEEKRYLDRRGLYQKILLIIKSRPEYFAWKYTKRMRKTAYWYMKRRKNFIYSIAYIASSNLLNRTGRKLGIECGENVFEKGLMIYHTQGIVVNGNARVGENCYLYGENCIGNDGKKAGCPQIGNNVRLCMGAKVIGDITIADNTVIAAGAVVVKDSFEQGAILAGIPAKCIGYVQDNNNFLA